MCESFGGLHDCVIERLLYWAKLMRMADPDADANLMSKMLTSWQRRLSVALLHGRINGITSAMDKLRGVPSRSNTVAYRISHPFRFVQEWGRLGERF